MLSCIVRINLSFKIAIQGSRFISIKEPSRYTSDPDIVTGQIRYGHKSTTLEYFYEHISDHVPIFMSIDIGNF